MTCPHCNLEIIPTFQRHLRLYNSKVNLKGYPMLAALDFMPVIEFNSPAAAAKAYCKRRIVYVLRKPGDKEPWLPLC